MLLTPSGQTVKKARANSTLSDVAKAAGVSASTASRALNGLAQKYRISEATEQLVKQSAERLGFRPSQVARSLRLQRTGLLGIVVPDLSNPFFSAIARAVTVAAGEKGFSAIIADSDGSVEKERELIEQMEARNVESLVVCPIGLDFAHLEAAASRGLPLVTVDRCQADSSLVQVTSDHLTGAHQAIELLIENGHRRIGILQGLHGTLPSERRLKGVREALAVAGIDYDHKLVAGDSFTEESGYRSARQLLTESPDLTALFAMSTPNAFGAFRAASELGRKIPENLSLICFDDVAFVEFMQVPLTTIAQNVPELGRRAALLATEQMQSGKSPRTKMHKVPIKLIQRASVGKVPPS